MSATNGHIQIPVVNAPTPPISYQVGSVLAVVDAAQWGPLSEFEVLGRISYLYAVLTLPQFNKEQFMEGFRESFQGYISGLI